jgi:chromosome segregation ATPase
VTDDAEVVRAGREAVVELTTIAAQYGPRDVQAERQAAIGAFNALEAALTRLQERSERAEIDAAAAALKRDSYAQAVNQWTGRYYEMEERFVKAERRAERAEDRVKKLEAALREMEPVLSRVQQHGLSSCEDARRNSLLNADQHSSGCTVEAALRLARALIGESAE